MEFQKMTWHVLMIMPLLLLGVTSFPLEADIPFENGILANTLFENGTLEETTSSSTFVDPTKTESSIAIPDSTTENEYITTGESASSLSSSPGSISYVDNFTENEDTSISRGSTMISDSSVNTSDLPTTFPLSHSDTFPFSTDFSSTLDTPTSPNGRFSGYSPSTDSAETDTTTTTITPPTSSESTETTTESTTTITTTESTTTTTTTESTSTESTKTESASTESISVSTTTESTTTESTTTESTSPVSTSPVSTTTESTTTTTESNTTETDTTSTSPLTTPPITTEPTDTSSSVPSVSTNTTTTSTVPSTTSTTSVTNTTAATTTTTTTIPITTSMTTTTDYSVRNEGGNVGLLIGIVVSVLMVGVCISLLLLYRSGKISWPPKNLFSDTSDSIRPLPIPLKRFPDHCNQMLDIPSRLSHEYQLLATLSVDIDAVESCSVAQQPDNKYKNRYVNILPYDSTRVKLPYEEGDLSDYINATYITGYTNEIEYIASQGPKEETCRDFWQMVHHEAVKVIVMVTQFEEQGKAKCFKYFPNLRENLVYDDITIRCTTELNFSIYTSRTLMLLKGNRKRSIIHLHFREWPDFGCPSSPDLMLQFCQVMRHHSMLSQPGITLVHCSAGVGRTGTLIAMDILLQCIKENKKIDIFGTVYKLRKQRMKMVQSEAQYVYLYKCVKEALEDPSYLSTEHSSTSSTEPIYENIESVRSSTAPEKVPQESKDYSSQEECEL